MPSPVYSAGSPGNLVNGVTVAANATIAAFLDLSAAFEGQVTCEMTTGSTAPGWPTTFSAYKVYGNSPPNTLAGAVAIGATSISVASSAGLHQAQKIALQQSGGSKLGEIVTISGAITGTGPYTVPVSATINSYAGGDGVYLIAQTATWALSPASPTGNWAASTDYSGEMILGTGQWVVAANNTDSNSSHAVTVTISTDKITAYQ